MRWPLALAARSSSAAAAVVPPLRPSRYNALLCSRSVFALQGSRSSSTTRAGWRAAARDRRSCWRAAGALGAYVLALLGLFDIFIDFRKWAEPPVGGRLGRV
jgi:hypothetical protein